MMVYLTTSFTNHLRPMLNEMKLCIMTGRRDGEGVVKIQEVTVAHVLQLRFILYYITVCHLYCVRYMLTS